MEQKRKKVALFYKILLGIVVVLLLAFVYIRFGVLRPWLTKFEAAQPKHASQEIFSDLFSPADWGRIYDLAGLEGSAYQDRAHFVQTMEELTAGQDFTLVETSAGLSGDRRYLVKSGSDSVAAFTLTSGMEGENLMWQLNTVEVLLGQTGSVLVRTLAGQRVLVNGTELSEDCQIQITKTAAERYLPEGVHGRQTILWQTQVPSLPQADVSVLDETGTQLPLRYDADSSCFAVELETEEPSEKERALLIGAAETYAKYMIRESNSTQLQKYFDRESEIYQTIRSSEIWMQNNSGYSFADETVSRFFRYGENLFSARVSLTLNVKRGNGTIKPYTVDSTLFFQNKTGAWRAFAMTNVDVQEEIVLTRLVFMDGETELCRFFVSSEERRFTPPSPPERPGQRFAGWAVRDQEGGHVTMTVRFQPGEDGDITLPAGYVLEPMTLYAAFAAE